MLPILAQVLSFAIGLFVLMVLSMIVSQQVKFLHKKGGTFGDYRKEEKKGIGLAAHVGIREQVLFYLAAIAGQTVFGFAVGGWLLLKGISRYRWEVPGSASDLPGPLSMPMDETHEAAALARNRFLVFAIGTAMSVAAGGLAGAAYHWMISCVS